MCIDILGAMRSHGAYNYRTVWVYFMVFAVSKLIYILRLGLRLGIWLGLEFGLGLGLIFTQSSVDSIFHISIFGRWHYMRAHGE